MILDGKTLSQEIQNAIKAQLQPSKKRPPQLVFLLVGDHPASLSYVQAKKQACANVGILSRILEFNETVSEIHLVHELIQLNRDPLVDGILVQLPLPPHISERTISSAILPSKDVDGLHPINVGKLLLGESGGFTPCTPLGIHTLLTQYHIPIAGKHVVIVGRSNLVGKPLAALLMQKKEHCNATVTVAHSYTENLSALTRQADILIAAMGQPRAIRGDMIQPNCTVIDVGIHRLSDGKIIGDVDFDSVSRVASHITPVPGGIGPMTIAMLLHNTLLSYTT